MSFGGHLSQFKLLNFFSYTGGGEGVKKGNEAPLLLVLQSLMKRRQEGQGDGRREWLGRWRRRKIECMSQRASS
jgi:hypothetical protein